MHITIAGKIMVLKLMAHKNHLAHKVFFHSINRMSEPIEDWSQMNVT